MENYDKCKAYCLQFLEVNKELGDQPAESHVVNMIGVLHYKKKEYDKAAEKYQEAMDLDSNNPSPYYNLGCINCLRGNNEKALKYLKKTLEIDPNYKEHMLKDEDIENIRETDEFKKLVE